MSADPIKMSNGSELTMKNQESKSRCIETFFEIVCSSQSSYNHFQVWISVSNLRERGQRSRRKSNLLVLLRESTLVLRGKKTRFS